MFACVAASAAILVFVCGWLAPSCMARCSERKCIACQDCLAETTKKGCFSVVSAKPCLQEHGISWWKIPKKTFWDLPPSCNLHTHKARSMQDAVCHCIDLSLCVCMVTLRAPFCWLNKQSSRAQTKVNAACLCCLGLGLCVWGPCFAGIRHAESAWPGPSITDFLQADRCSSCVGAVVGNHGGPEIWHLEGSPEIFHLETRLAHHVLSIDSEGWHACHTVLL